MAQHVEKFRPSGITFLEVEGDLRLKDKRALHSSSDVASTVAYLVNQAVPTVFAAALRWHRDAYVADHLTSAIEDRCCQAGGAGHKLAAREGIAALAYIGEIGFEM